MLPLNSESTIVEPYSLHVIHGKFQKIFLKMSKVYRDSLYCSDFLDVQQAILEHYRQALGYMNKSIIEIRIQHPLTQIHSCNLAHMIGLTPQYSSKIPLHLQPQISIHSIQQQIHQLNIEIDQLAFMVRDCPNLETRVHVLFIAKAMTELFEIQQFYIYPFYPNLIPLYLRKGMYNKI